MVAGAGVGEGRHTGGRAMIYDDFSEGGWPRARWLEHRYPHEDIWDSATIVRCPGAPDNSLTLDLRPFTRSHFNHVKAMAMSSTVHDLSACKGFTLRAELSVEITGTERNPHGLDPGDPRLAAGALVLVDPSTGMVFDFFITNDRIAPLYERLPIARDALGPYPAFSRLLEPAPNRKGAWRAYEIAYDRESDTVEWRVDGVTIARRERVGAPIGRSGPVVKLGRLRFGCGLFTLLDDLWDDQEAAADHPQIKGFIPDNRHDLFGQGGRVSMRAIAFDC